MIDSKINYKLSRYHLLFKSKERNDRSVRMFKCFITKRSLPGLGVGGGRAVRIACLFSDISHDDRRSIDDQVGGFDSPQTGKEFFLGKVGSIFRSGREPQSEVVHRGGELQNTFFFSLFEYWKYSVV